MAQQRPVVALVVDRHLVPGRRYVRSPAPPCGPDVLLEGDEVPQRRCLYRWQKHDLVQPPPGSVLPLQLPHPLGQRPRLLRVVGDKVHGQRQRLRNPQTSQHGGAVHRLVVPQVDEADPAFPRMPRQLEPHHFHGQTPNRNYACSPSIDQRPSTAASMALPQNCHSEKQIDEESGDGLACISLCPPPQTPRCAWG